MKWSASKIISLHSLVALSLRFAILRRKKNPLKATTQLRFNTNYTITYIVYLIQNFPLMRRQRMPSYIFKNFSWKGQIHNFILIYAWVIHRQTSPHIHIYAAHRKPNKLTHYIHRVLCLEGAIILNRFNSLMTKFF